MVRLGTGDPSGAPTGGLHSARFRPAFRPAIATGVTAMSAALIDLLRPSPAPTR
jgi:metal-dependent amidase/aminoacylase/carboxypeptidase family protein